jgi:hypothetical protein
MVRVPHQFSAYIKQLQAFHFFLILPQSITAHDDKYIWCKALSQPQSNAGSVDIARSAPHTLLIQRDGLDIHLMAVFLFDLIVFRILFVFGLYCSCSPTTRSSIHRWILLKKLKSFHCTRTTVKFYMLTTLLFIVLRNLA